MWVFVRCQGRDFFNIHLGFPHAAFLIPQQMTQNMFQEGLYHVFFKEAPSTRQVGQALSQGELVNARIHRWFGTVVNTRLLVTGVRYFHALVQTVGQVLSLSIFLLHIRCASPPGGADPQCLRLHTNHSHSCMCELQLLCFHVNACVVKPVCESNICLNRYCKETVKQSSFGS